MSGSTKTRISPQQLQSDVDTYSALKAITDYEPRNPLYSTQSAGNALERMRAAAEAIIQSKNTLSAARDALVVAENDFHAIIVGVKNETRVIYGLDSDQVAALGLKKTSERAKPKRTKKTPPAA